MENGPSALNSGEQSVVRPMRPPPRLRWLAEYRSVWELGFSLAAAPMLLRAPRGDGHPVLVIPGFLASDFSTTLLRNYLRRLGYDAHSWEQGRNFGGIGRRRSANEQRLRTIHEATGQRVTLIGWSLGGVYARLLAQEVPDAVRSVISLGSPFSREPGVANVSAIYEILSGEKAAHDVVAGRRLFPHEFDNLDHDLAMPSTSIYTKTDGVVNWRACLVRPNVRTENIEVIGASHVGLGMNAAVLWAVADRLSQPQDIFKPFNRRGPFALAYGRPTDDERSSP